MVAAPRRFVGAFVSPQAFLTYGRCSAPHRGIGSSGLLARFSMRRRRAALPVPHRGSEFAINRAGLVDLVQRENDRLMPELAHKVQRKLLDRAVPLRQNLPERFAEPEWGRAA